MAATEAPNDVTIKQDATEMNRLSETTSHESIRRTVILRYDTVKSDRSDIKKLLGLMSQELDSDEKECVS